MKQIRSKSRISQELGDLSTKRLLAKLSPAGQRKYLDIQLATDFSAFIMKVFETVSGHEEFRSNWHIDAMAYAAQLVIDGKLGRLIVTLPPRHLKSIIFSVALPAFLLGRDPTKRIICVSYSNELAVKHANDFRAVLGSHWYQRIFPNTKVSCQKDTQTETMTASRGFRMATSLGGTITGRGAHLIILDDPQKPEEALSEAQRNHAAQWFDTTLQSRLDSKVHGAVVLVMQRLHQDDLVGRVLEKGGWHQLKIAAIAEQDERIQLGPRRPYLRKANTVIDPGREPLEALQREKQRIGSLNLSAQYQQEAIPLEGNLIKRDWIREYDTVPTYTSTDTLVISIDTAMKGEQISDFSVGTVWLVRNETCYLIDLWRARVDFPELKRAILSLRAKYPQATFLIEDKGSGTSLIQELRVGNIGVVAIIPEGDKVTRCAAISGQFEAGCVLLPKKRALAGRTQTRAPRLSQY